MNEVSESPELENATALSSHPDHDLRYAAITSSADRGADIFIPSNRTSSSSTSTLEEGEVLDVFRRFREISRHETMFYLVKINGLTVAR